MLSCLVLYPSPSMVAACTWSTYRSTLLSPTSYSTSNLISTHWTGHCGQIEQGSGLGKLHVGQASIWTWARQQPHGREFVPLSPCPDRPGCPVRIPTKSLEQHFSSQVVQLLHYYLRCTSTSAALSSSNCMLSRSSIQLFPQPVRTLSPLQLHLLPRLSELCSSLPPAPIKTLHLVSFGAPP